MTAQGNKSRRWFGRATEARFIADAQAQGLIVSRPFVEAPGYDCVVDNGRRLIRVQIKGCTPKKGHCVLNVRRHRNRKPPQFDWMVVWVNGVGRWFFVPGYVRRKSQVNMFLNGKFSRIGWECLTR